MPLTNEQLHEIREIISDYHTAFIINVVGIDAVAPQIVEQLKAKGLVDVDVKSIEDAYLYGQIMALASDPKLAEMSYPDFLEHVRKNPVPLTDVERRAIRFAEQQTAQFVVGLGNKVDQTTGQLLIEADSALRAETRGIIRDATAENIARRQSVKKLKSDLGWAKKDWARDWDRIAITEKHNSMQRGLADSLSERYGSDVRVVKRPAPDCCEHCDRLYLGPDGQPRIFKLSDLERNGLTNFGRKARDWLPVVGATHPHCQCQVVRVPIGWGFDEDGSMVPGGELGVAYESAAEFQKAFRAESDLQKAYALQGHVTFQGMDIAIENKVGSVRNWTDAEGNQGSTTMLNAYGYVKGTEGADGDDIDVFLGPDPKATNAFIIHQQNPNAGTYDETKVMLGFSSMNQAKYAYQSHYDRPDFMIWAESMTVENFKRWCAVTAGDRPFRQGKPTDTFVILEKSGPIATGKRGGKIYGYDGKGKPIYTPSSNKSVSDLEKRLRKEYDVQLWLSDRGESFALEKIIVPERGKGVGSKVMQELADYADRNNKIITASPSSDFGGTKGRVVKFNKRFGFVENKGRKKDYRFQDTMMRHPQGLKKAQTLRELGSTGNIPAFVAAAASPAGDRNPGPGTVINQLVGSRRTPPPTIEDLKPTPREHVEEQAHLRDRKSQTIDRDQAMLFDEPLSKPVERFVIPDREPYKVEIDEEEVAHARELAEKQIREKQAGNRNRVEITDDDSKKERDHG